MPLYYLSVHLSVPGNCWAIGQCQQNLTKGQKSQIDYLSCANWHQIKGETQMRAMTKQGSLVPYSFSDETASCWLADMY